MKRFYDKLLEIAPMVWGTLIMLIATVLLLLGFIVLIRIFIGVI